MAKAIKSIKVLRRRGLDQIVPTHGLLYFDHLNAELRSKSLDTLSQDNRDVIEDILKRRAERALTWNDLYTFDLILSRLLSSERLAREVWSLRARYRDIAGLKEYEAYLASKPPDPAGQVEEKALRADIEFLLGEIYLRYAITPINQMVSDRISKRVTTVILVGVFIILAFVLMRAANIGGEWQPATLLTPLFVGAMGGLLSMQQRYQSISREGDPIDNITELTQGWSRLFLPAISGAIFAVLLYMLVMGGLLKGDLFPTLNEQASEANKTNGVGLSHLLQHGRPDSSSSYAKLIIWSFIAGFAERFVPDTLSGFISKRETDSKGSA
jgi:hypothetical protein